MDIKEYIKSGILELYVYGALTEAESEEVTGILQKYPEARAEVEAIEAAVMNLAATMAPGDPKPVVNVGPSKTGDEYPGTLIKDRSPWISYIGWAASIILIIGVFYLFAENRQLKNSLESLHAENLKMENKIAAAREDAEKAEELLAELRSQNVTRVLLEGQNIAPEAYAIAWWNKNTNTTFIDAKGLPEPPEGMVYQVWSLKLDPLEPTSIGLLQNFEEKENKIFNLENPNSSQAFGITLEPAGGSQTPTLEKLYTLGAVSS